ncbi:hypothetical protein HELRODRAFT_171638 [Helobdella robusta]|uniref:Uncharacterized protein n=1 Tax=Helobdella robusta TaxID=6412 RepID=T1F4H8_HELRO|nr:hypothetical protein HELRODRAFT_171638 [Helobdella robusta]ESO05279.1 hypothetical protein HELRODRAFT_171638 [Helobdella robusta]
MIMKKLRRNVGNCHLMDMLTFDCALQCTYRLRSTWDSSFYQTNISSYLQQKSLRHKLPVIKSAPLPRFMSIHSACQPNLTACNFSRIKGPNKFKINLWRGHP